MKSCILSSRHHLLLQVVSVAIHSESWLKAGEFDLTCYLGCVRLYLTIIFYVKHWNCAIVQKKPVGHSLWQSVWVFTHLIRMSLFQKQISLFTKREICISSWMQISLFEVQISLIKIDNKSLFHIESKISAFKVEISLFWLHTSLF